MLLVPFDIGEIIGFSESPDGLNAEFYLEYWILVLSIGIGESADTSVLNSVRCVT